MGLLSKLFRGGGGGRDANAPAAAPEPASGPEPAPDSAPPDPPVPEPPPVACVVLRQGMDVPDDDYLRRVAEAEKPGMLAAGVALRGLSQPRWFAKDEWMESGARIVADAYEQELAIDPAKTGYWESTGPDGAKILVVFLRR